jgi:hypothetical protein
LQAAAGRGPHAQLWVSWLHQLLLQEFKRLRKAGVPITITNQIIQDMQTNDQFNRNSRDKTGMLISDRICYKWVDHFRRKRKLVTRASTGRRLLRPKVEAFLKKTIAITSDN